MSGVDFGKQVGPLPLGAWVVVVAGGLGLAWYTRRSGGAPVVVEDTSGTPGVGTGAVGGWTPTAPSASDTTTTPSITDNDSWARAAINYLLAQGYPANVSDSAIRKYISGTKLSTQEYALLGIALLHLKAPPTPLPPDEGDVPSGADTVAAPNLQITNVVGDWVYLQWTSVPGATMYEITCTGAKNSGTSGHLFNSYGWWAGQGSGLVTFTVRAKVDGTYGPASAPVSTQV